MATTSPTRPPKPTGDRFLPVAAYGIATEFVIVILGSQPIAGRRLERFDVKAGGLAKWPWADRKAGAIFDQWLGDVRAQLASTNGQIGGLASSPVVPIYAALRPRPVVISRIDDGITALSVPILPARVRSGLFLIQFRGHDRPIGRTSIVLDATN